MTRWTSEVEASTDAILLFPLNTRINFAVQRVALSFSFFDARMIALIFLRISMTRVESTAVMSVLETSWSTM